MGYLVVLLLGVVAGGALEHLYGATVVNFVVTKYVAVTMWVKAFLAKF